MNKGDKPSGCSISFGIVLYYFDDPGTIQDELLYILAEFAKCYPGEFTRISEDGETFKAFRAPSNMAEWFGKRLTTHDFCRSLFFSLTDATPSRPASHRILFSGVRIDKAFKGKLPNYLYFELPNEVDVEFGWHLFRESFAAHDFYLGLGNHVIVTDDDTMPRSGANAAKQLRQSNLFLQTFLDSFRNYSYLMLLEKRQDEFLMHPSEFVGCGKELIRRLTFTEALSASGPKQVNFEFLPLDCAWFFRASDTAQLISLSRFLSPHYAIVEKPLMFWRPSEWNAWLRKVCGETPGEVSVSH